MMYIEGKTADEIFSSTAQKLLFTNVPVPVISVEHLIALKLFAAHSNPDRIFKELSDVKELLNRVDIKDFTVKKYFLKYGLEKYYDEIIKNRRNIV